MILGGPGSGKTTLGVQLLCDSSTSATAAHPVPVLLTANGWDTTAHPRLRDWLAFRLGWDYPAQRAIDGAMPGELADSGMVLPVIDGLDELAPDYRPALLTTLNDSLGGTDPLVLTCRTDEYVDAVENADVLTAAAVIEARPLTARSAADYLDGCLPPRQRPAGTRSSIRCAATTTHRGPTSARPRSGCGCCAASTSRTRAIRPRSSIRPATRTPRRSRPTCSTS